MEICGQDGCGGRRLTDDRCLAHSRAGELAVATQRWRRGEPIDVRDMQIDGASLQKLLAAIARADVATHPAPLSPDRKAEIWSEINFEGAQFLDVANFRGVVFKGSAYFDHAEFCDQADFRGAEFCNHADFDNAEFAADVTFRGAIFNDHAGFQDASFDQDAMFESAKFRSYVDLDGTQFGAAVNLKAASFQFVRRLGPFRVGTLLELDQCEFGERIAIEVEAERISASAAIFAEGVRLLVQGEEMKLDCVDFGRSSTLSTFVGSDERDASTVGEEEGHSPESETGPKLLTLYGAQVSSLAISGVNLEDCRFAGAHGLERMIVEPSCEWRKSPKRWWLKSREIIFEEQRWRAGRKYQFCWRMRSRGAVAWRIESDALENWPGAREEEGELKADDVAALYRALRKAREDNNDQAGASDLYYGEMEMRLRVARPKGRGFSGWVRGVSDKGVIAAYWLLSGYGLRAIRAFAAWVAVVVLAALALRERGFVVAPSFPHVLLFSVASTSSLIRVVHPPKGFDLRGIGEAIEVGLRVVGPLLIGLWLLALRARVKR